MCAVCGLPTTHSNTVQALGILALFSFVITTFVGAWLTIMWYQARRLWHHSEQSSTTDPTPPIS